jgi:glycosyltransferase involved in cell wall biosynthesis
VTDRAVTEAENPSARIAVAIPCYNEAAAIATVVAEFRAALPDAEIVVFDNNSTDGTGELARGLGVRVVPVPRQGKGHAVRAAFGALPHCDVLVLTDGDGTYPARCAPLLVAPVLAGAADMAVGARQPAPGAGAMTLTRGLGNHLIRAAFRLLIGSGNSDLLSGYRAFSRRFRATVQLRSTGFEIETELTSEAVARRHRVVEVPVPYLPRIAGTQSKLLAFRDGLRILVTIVIQGIRLRPHRLLVAWLLPCVALALLVHWGFAAAGGLGLFALWSLVLIDIRARRREERYGHD